jgi:hypothetical protein
MYGMIGEMQHNDILLVQPAAFLVARTDRRMVWKQSKSSSLVVCLLSLLYRIVYITAHCWQCAFGVESDGWMA